MTKVILRKGEEDRILAGHPWVYDNEILRTEGHYRPGDPVEVFSSKMMFLGCGFINPASKIRVRLYSRFRTELTVKLLEERIGEAWEYRKLAVEHDTCRVVFAEADRIPALIVDKFTDAGSGDVFLVLQSLALGIDLHKQEIVKILSAIFKPKGVFERNDVPVREREGLDLRTGYLSEPFDPEIVIRENGILFHVNLSAGQKTGYYLDQRENHAAIAPYCRNAKVLDAFAHTGAFALHASRYGAASVTAVDISEDAAAMIERNAVLNGFSNITSVTANVFDFLRELQNRNERFDLIILDPPAFAKSRSVLETAARGYKDINFRAMKLLNTGGVLVTCSCSQAMDPERFKAVLRDAAIDAGRAVRQIEQRTQAKDHPVLYGYDESLYLKCFILEVR